MAKRFLALGDSYTIGESVRPDERWPAQLAVRLRQEGLDLAEPELVATTGWTTDELWRGIDEANPRGPFELVSLLIGVNNQFRGRDEREYREEFVKLLKRAIAFAGGDPARVLVLSIPDWGITPFAATRDRAEIARAIDRFNTINREETLRLGAHYVDVTPSSRRATADASLVASDGLHPSAKMYREWVDVALPLAVKILRPS